MFDIMFDIQSEDFRTLFLNVKHVNRNSFRYFENQLLLKTRFKQCRKYKLSSFLQTELQTMGKKDQTKEKRRN